MYNNKGFTLLEIILVIGLIGILSAIAIPGIKPIIASYRISSEASNVRSALQIAKTTAIKEQKTAVVNFVPGTGSDSSYNVVVNGEIIKSGTLRSTITMYRASFQGNSFAQFNSMGLTSGGSGAVCLTDAEETIYKQVSLSAAGNIKIQKNVVDPNGPWED